MLFLNVVFPHLITIIAGTVLFFIGLLGHLGPI